MAFLAFQTANFFYGYFLALAVVQFCVVALVLFVIIVFLKFHFRLAVAVDTPAHTEGGILVDHFHFLYRAVAFLTCDLANGNVLGVVEISVVGQVVDTCPLNWTLDFAVRVVF